jgi:hypothetical protein
MKNKMLLNKVLLFGTGFLQVSLITAQTWMVSHAALSGMIIVSFLISFVWTINVKRVAFGGWVDRFIYSAGASAGALCGILIAMHFS